MSTLAPTPLSDSSARIYADWRRMSGQRTFYTVLGIGLIFLGFCGAVWFADESNAGHFFERLPHLFDFLEWLIPRDWSDVWRALFDLPSPNAATGEEFNFPNGRVDIGAGFYIPEYFWLMLVTINIAIVSTVVAFIFAVPLSFLAAKNLAPNGVIRVTVKRICELFRAFPEIVIAGLLVAIFSIGPIGAIAAVAIHTVGALGKLFYEVVENADMKPDEGLRAVGSNWFERVRYGIVPQVMPNFISYALLRTEINVRASTIIGAVGGGGIGEIFRRSLSNDHPAKTYAIVLMLFLTIIAIDWLSGYLRKRLVGSAAFQFGV